MPRLIDRLSSITNKMVSSVSPARAAIRGNQLKSNNVISVDFGSLRTQTGGGGGNNIISSPSSLTILNQTLIVQKSILEISKTNLDIQARQEKSLERIRAHLAQAEISDIIQIQMQERQARLAEENALEKARKKDKDSEKEDPKKNKKKFGPLSLLKSLLAPFGSLASLLGGGSLGGVVGGLASGAGGLLGGLASGAGSLFGGTASLIGMILQPLIGPIISTIANTIGPILTMIGRPLLIAAGTWAAAEGLNFFRELLEGKKFDETRLGGFTIEANKQLIEMFSAISTNAGMFARGGDIIPIVGPLVGGIMGLMTDGIEKFISFLGKPETQLFINKANDFLIKEAGKFGVVAEDMAGAFSDFPIVGPIVGGILGLSIDVLMLALEEMRKKIFDFTNTAVDFALPYINRELNLWSEGYQAMSKQLTNDLNGIIDYIAKGIPSWMLGADDMKATLEGMKFDTEFPKPQKVSKSKPNETKKAETKPQPIKPLVKVVNPQDVSVIEHPKFGKVYQYSTKPVSPAKPTTTTSPPKGPITSMETLTGQKMSNNINAEKGKRLLISALAEAGITDPIEVAQFLGQMSHESGGFTKMVEMASGQQYEGKIDLGNTQPGDGPRFKGRGFVQLTGRYNYGRYGPMVGLDLINNPDQAAVPEVAARIAVAYWRDRVRPVVSNFRDTSAVTYAINGGFNGLNDRMKRVNDFMSESGQIPNMLASANAISMPSMLPTGFSGGIASYDNQSLANIAGTALTGVQGLMQAGNTLVGSAGGMLSQISKDPVAMMQEMAESMKTALNITIPQINGMSGVGDGGGVQHAGAAGNNATSSLQLNLLDLLD